MTPKTRTSTLIAVGAAMLASGWGCQSSRSMLPVEHRSSPPAVGLQLAPKTESVNRSDAMGEEDSLRNAQPVTLEEPKPVARESSWSRLLGGKGQPKPVPLPRTDLPQRDIFDESTASQSISDIF